MLSINFVDAPYQLTPNQSFEFSVRKAVVKVQIGENWYSGKGFKINDVLFNQRTIIQATVDSLGGDNVLWTLSSGDEFASKLADWNLVDESTLSDNILNPISIIQDFLENPSLVTNGLGLIFYPFLGTNRTITYFEALGNETHYKYLFFITKISNVEYETHYNKENQLLTFESAISGNFNQNISSPYFNITFTHHSQLVYDISIGLLYGSRFYSEGEGIFLDEQISYSFESHTELENYNLPKSLLGMSNFPRFIVIGVSSSTAALAIIIFVIHYKIKKEKSN
jgi:hypothetical protein